ncbi:MAG TPA: aminoglycoside phosphotransferase family protein, partial [Acidimicrobiales bacterium]|nr:aminoglycoside phosphotransferase family protein [Acidimicrobiales bacterium]
VAMGHPGEGYPFEWSIHAWLPGHPASDGLNDLDQAATDLAAFIMALRDVDTTGAPERTLGARGAPLIEKNDDFFRASLEQLGNRIDRRSVLDLWESALAAPAWQGEEVWVHGDLLPGNLLVRDDRLSAVIDWGGLNVGDPACDLQPAWNVFTRSSRETFRSALGGVDKASWLRGRGWVVYQAVAALAYYRETNPGMVRQASHALAEVLADGSG